MNALHPVQWLACVVLPLSTPGLEYLSAVPIRVLDKVAGLLTLGFKERGGPQADSAM